MTTDTAGENNLLRTIIDASLEQFEQLLQAASLFHPSITLQLSKLRERLTARDERAQLFSGTIADELNKLVCSLRVQLSMAPLAVQVVSAGIAAKVAEGTVLQAEIEPLLAAMEQAFADRDEAEALQALMQDALAYWAERRAHAFYALRMHGSKDLSLLSQEMMDDINGIQDVCRRIEEGDETFLKSAGFSFYIIAPPVTRYPTPLPALTASLGGGFARRESTLFLAPQGAGKTVMACQLGAHFALQGLKVMLISTEEGQERMDRRVFANLANLDYGKIKDNFNYTTVSAADSDRVGQVTDLLAGRLQYADWMYAGDDASIVSEAAFTDLILRKEKELTEAYNFGDFDVIMLDWVGSALGSFVELTSKGVPLRHLLLQAANNLAEIAKRRNKISILFTQATAGISYNRKRIDMSCLSECKDMGQRQANIIGLSAMYQKEEKESMNAAKLYAEMQWMCVSKSRFGEGGEIPVTRRFKHMRFEKFG